MHSASQTDTHIHTDTAVDTFKMLCSQGTAKTLWFPLAWAAIHQLGASQPGWQGLTEWHVSFIKRGAPGLRKRTDRHMTKPPESSAPLTEMRVCHGIDTEKSTEIEHTWIHSDTNRGKTQREEKRLCLCLQLLSPVFYEHRYFLLFCLFRNVSIPSPSTSELTGLLQSADIHLG